LLQNLLHRGLLVPDATDMGISVDRDQRCWPPTATLWPRAYVCAWRP